MEEKVKVHEFSLSPYPLKLWVAITTNNLGDVFKEVSDFEEDCDAIVSSVVNNEGFKGCLIRFSSIDCINFATVAHEAFHVAADCCEYIGATIEVDNQEFVAYLIGYVAKCCEEVKNFHNKIHK